MPGSGNRGGNLKRKRERGFFSAISQKISGRSEHDREKRRMISSEPFSRNITMDGQGHARAISWKGNLSPQAS